jgi:S1-C subfamily serine protease
VPRPALIGILFSLAASLARADSLASLEAEQAALFERVAPGVVLVSAGKATGAGFAVTPGLVLTAAHVVAGHSDVAVILRGGRTVAGRVLELAAGGLDVALVAVAAQDLAPLALARASALRAGSVVASVGHPDGSRWTLAVGLVAQDPADAADPRLLRLQLPLRAGASGGPVVDREGRVVGVVSLGAAETAATFAVRIEAAERALPALARARERAGTVAQAPAGR